MSLLPGGKRYILGTEGPYWKLSSYVGTQAFKDGCYMLSEYPAWGIKELFRSKKS